VARHLFAHGSGLRVCEGIASHHNQRILVPIVYHQLIPANAAQPGYMIAKELARQQVAQFGAVRGAGVGIGPGSCCASLAVAPNPGAGFGASFAIAAFGVGPGVPPPVLGGALPYAVVYGNSQMAAGGLVMGPVGGHAERAALTAANNAGLGLYMFAANAAVLFVELQPCGPCQNWLNGGGGGVANPFNGVINGLGGGAVTLHVWYRWTYPGPPALPVIGLAPALGITGPAAMQAFHGMNLPNELIDINGPTW
jgi:hypothetical protein